VLACAGLLLGCGSRTVTLPEEGTLPGTPTSAAYVDVPSTLLDARLDKVVARSRGWCGLEQDNGDLVCGVDGAILEQRTGPFIDVDLSDASDWSYRCTVRASGELECDGAQLQPPNGVFASVSVGLYSACARGAGNSACWSIDGALRIHLPQSNAGSLSVQAGNVCWGEDGHFECRGPLGERWLPAAGHYWAASATRNGACAAIVPPTDGTDSSKDPELDAVLRTAQIACFSKDGMQHKVLGVFDLMDVDAEGDGCAQDQRTGQPVCWGRFVGSLPRGMHYSQISVSTHQVCWLGWDGSLECTSAGG
jgi:hypothetical protein